MAKSADAFRTISEVADWLGVPTHVLRFWESKFPQVKPVKRAGGRRYYRPNDMLLLAGIRVLLHDDGMTIRGVQKILREKGVKHVVAMADREVVVGVDGSDTPEPVKPPEAPPVSEDDNIVDLPRKEVPKPETTVETATEPEATVSETADEATDTGEVDAVENEDQMTLFASSEKEEVTDETVEPTSDGESDSTDALPDLPGPSPVGGPSLGPLLEQIVTASPEVADEMRQVLSAHKDRLEALRDRLRDTPDTSGSDSDT